MLKRIMDVQGVGLLHNADGKRYLFEKGTLIYAENGRGKSTLASILRSASTADASIVLSRATLGGTVAPGINLQFDSGHRVTMQSGAWSERRAELLVFDAEFIDRNVHSGGTITPAQRKNLLDFALGEGAVTAQSKLDAVRKLASDASAKLKGIEARLSGYHTGVSLEAFKRMEPVHKPEETIAELRKRLEAAKSITAIKNRPVPAVQVLPTLDIEALFSILRTSLEDIHQDAERIVKEHVAKVGSAYAENWISQGRQLEHDESCPYCGQSLEGVELIQAYRTFFNQEYHRLQRQVAVLEDGVSRRTSQEIIDRFSSGVATVQAIAGNWAEHVELGSINFDANQASALMVELREHLYGLAKAKVMNPTVAVGTDDQKAEVESLWAQLLRIMQQCNQAIESTASMINAYKQSLEAESPEQLLKGIQDIELAHRRQGPGVVDLFAQLDAAKKDSNQLERQKKTAKAELDSLMQETLGRYERAINDLLRRFGASFSIHQMSTNHKGGAPRTEYALSLRGQAVAIDRGEPTFATALSEGDKRTLAFAFFVASVLADPNLDQKVVVIDDPMCSLDLNRKQQTRRVLREIYDQSEQLILLAHDLYFLRDFRDDLSKDDRRFAVIQMKHAAGRYTDFDNIDIDSECASRYFRDHMLLTRFVAGEATEDSRLVARSIRPMLEGYLHRRFPGLLPKKLMFGGLVALIREALPESPLAYAQSLVEELNDINSYAGLFHHNTNPDADSVEVIDGELIGYAERALNVVYQGTAP